MHIYIYDNYVNDKKYQPQISKIETRITDLGLSGKIIRLGAMNSVYNIVEEEIKKGAKTIIAIGDNGLLNQVVNAIAKLKNVSTPIGFIPVGKTNNELANFLGIPINEEACDVLSARRIEHLDLGKINNSFFLFNSTISTEDTKIEIDKNYSIEIIKRGEISVINIPTQKIPKEIKPSAKDNILELLINTKGAIDLFSDSQKNANNSVFSFKKLHIVNDKKPITVDSSIKIPTPVEITIAKEKINLIVGKNRSF